MPDGSALRYRAEIDLESVNDAHTMGILLCPPGSRVLDVGCAAGDVAAALGRRGCRVWGVEIDAVAADRAAAHCQEVVVGDVETLDLTTRWSGLAFDVVLCLDVLEHLRDPVATLRRLVPLLAEGGRVVASIPNVAHGAIRLSLLAGRFTYVDCGLLDRTHLHFFDAASVDELFRDAGLTVVERLQVTRGLTDTEVKVDPSRFPATVVEGILADPQALIYQFVRVAVPTPVSPDGVATDRDAVQASLAEVLQRRLAERERVLREHVAALAEARAEVERLADARSRVEELEATLRQRMQELEDAATERRHLQLDLVVKDQYMAELRARLAEAETELEHLRYRLADRINALLWRVPLVHHAVKALVRVAAAGWRRVRRRP